MNMKDKHIVIAGGSSGIGFAIARQAQLNGAKATLLGRSVEKLQNAKQHLPQEACIVPCNIGDAHAAQQAFNQIGTFDYFVSTAADLTYAPLSEMPIAAIESMLTGKFWGPIHFVKYGLPHIQPGGAIVFFSGLAADRPALGTSMVSSLNASVEGLVKALAVELAPIRVNGISPGVVDTEGWNFMPDEERKHFFARLEKKLPTGKVGTPADLADATLFALSNPYLTGEILHVNGGGSLV